VGNKVRISVIIVNYNVEYFLEQCLNSVEKALQYVEGEVFVVDNNSIDGSVEMVRQKFPHVHLIANKHNPGFSIANNQAIRIAKGDYMLLLNPDTVVEELTFKKVIDFMDAHPDAGGLGVRMLDGKGKFLPESKRGLPTPDVAFYKIFGFSRLFPKSKRFGKYHLGYLSEFETHEVDILSGAFMLMRKETLDKVGLLDETFFMYGEDVDLSYRIQLGGYKNYYFADTRIIHYKGESTKKSSVNYVFVFYRAMVIFAEKHFSQKNAKLFSLLINIAIYLRASLAILSRFIKRITLPAIDFLLLFTGLNLLTRHWLNAGIVFTENVATVSIPVYTLVWFVSALFSSVYDVPPRIKKFFHASLVGTLFILVCYALLPKEWQFSRLYILTGALWVIVYYVLSRLYLHYLIGKKFSLWGTKNQKFVIVGTPEESERVSSILKQTNSKIESIQFVSQDDTKHDSQLGILSQLDQIVYIQQIDEVIFCAKDTTAQTILEWMSNLSSLNVDFKIAQPDSLYLIGSNSIDTAGDLYVLNINQIVQANHIRNKRTFDVLFSFSALVLSPIVIFFYSNKKSFIRNMFRVLIGKKSLVGYSTKEKMPNHLTPLPSIKSGILSPRDGFEIIESTNESKLNLLYARNYSVWKDVAIVYKSWRKLENIN
jgi:O-antigen biosynthesis protein